MTDAKRKQLRGSVVLYAVIIGIAIDAIALCLAALWAASQWHDD
jgi:hypothetical protein